MRIAVTYPVYVSTQKHWEYMVEMVRSLKSKHELYLIPVVNCITLDHQPIDTLVAEQGRVLMGRQPQSVAKAWNDGIACARDVGSDYVLVLNTDVVLKPESIDNLLAFVDQHPEACLWTMGEYKDREAFDNLSITGSEPFGESPHFSAFMVKSNFPDEVGLFDENFVSSYFEDNDVAVRIVQAKKKALLTWTAPFFHYGSATIRNDMTVGTTNHFTFEANRKYFLEKWGSLPHPAADYYAHPYDEADKPLSYWRNQ